MNGGYKMIDKSSNKIYSELVACLTLGKPILWYEDKNTCFFIDTISGGEVTTEIVDDEEVTTYGDIILTKGGKTITITAENVVTEDGEIQPSSGGIQFLHLTLNDEDKIEQDLTNEEIYELAKNQPVFFIYKEDDRIDSGIIVYANITADGYDFGLLTNNIQPYIRYNSSTQEFEKFGGIS